MSRNVLRQAKFLLSAPTIEHMPKDEGIEIAFAGRSNAGKSSALNTLTEQKSLARISKTPGRTQLINVFTIDDDRRLIDLPGYGFAQVPLEVKAKWQAALSEYLQERTSLSGVVILMDIRHPMKDVDQKMIEWAVYNHLPVLLLLTKADKLSRGEMNKQVFSVQKQVKQWSSEIRIIPFSSLKKTGCTETLAILHDWYNINLDDSLTKDEYGSS